VESRRVNQSLALPLSIGSGFRWWLQLEKCRYAKISQLFGGVEKCGYVGVNRTFKSVSYFIGNVELAGDGEKLTYRLFIRFSAYWRQMKIKGIAQK
jgi:hypothetical protein